MDLDVLDTACRSDEERGSYPFDPPVDHVEEPHHCRLRHPCINECFVFGVKFIVIRWFANRVVHERHVGKDKAKPRQFMLDVNVLPLLDGGIS